ncbi:MAG: preprotein translocase subunit SecG [Pseudomonadota bacterium]
MESILLGLHYVICIFLIITILLQAGKGADIGAVFGGGSQTVFGSRGPATFLNKLTVIVAFTFLVTSIWLAHIARTKSITSVMDTTPVAAEQTTEEAVPATTTEKKADEPKKQDSK